VLLQRASPPHLLTHSLVISRSPQDQLQPQQRDEYREIFAFFDKKGEGSIPIKEVGVMMKTLGGRYRTPSRRRPPPTRPPLAYVYADVGACCRVASTEALKDNELKALCKGGDKLDFNTFLANREEKWAREQSGYVRRDSQQHAPPYLCAPTSDIDGENAARRSRRRSACSMRVAAAPSASRTSSSS